MRALLFSLARTRLGGRARLALARCAAVRAGLVLGLAASCLGAPARLEAQANEQANIELRPGATCLDEARLRDGLGHWLSGPALPPGLQIDVQGSVHDPRTVLVRIYAAGAEVARRSFSPGPERCDDLHSAVALAIALMLKIADAPPAAEESQEPQSQEPQPQPEPEPEAEPQLPPPARPHADSDRAAGNTARVTPGRAGSVRTERSPWGELSVQASGLYGRSADRFAAGGFRSELSLALARAFQLRAGLVGLFSFARGLADSDGTYTTRELAGTAGGCVALLQHPTARLGLCSELWAGRLAAVGANFDPARSARLPWWSAALQLELGWQLSTDWLLVVSAAPVLSLRRTQLVARNDQDMIVGRSELPRISVMLGVGLAYTLARPPVR